MADRVEKGRPVQILRTKDDHSFHLDVKALGRILYADHVKDKPVVVVSVVGAHRKGKSFLLNFFLRYIRCEGQTDWLGDPNVPLKGFSWRGGSELDTRGIVLWDEVFLVTTTRGQQLAVLFMDTQGTFDGESTVKDCATIFALSTMTSSVQVYNLSQNIKEDDLQHLQLFTEYGRLAQQTICEKPFQKLLFLVRDWSSPSYDMYGAKGGRSLLDRRLQTSVLQPKELKALRRHMRSCFSEIGCFLMPHPGPKVATSNLSDGRLSDISDDFKIHLQELVLSLLAPDNLLVKEINGRKILCKDLMKYFQVYVNVFNGYKLPQPKSIFEATAQANNLTAMTQAMDMYTRGMRELCYGNKPYPGIEVLMDHHLRLRESAKELFNATRKMGGTEFSRKYLDRLTQEIDGKFEEFFVHDKNRNKSAAFRTPFTLFKLMVTSFFMSCVSALLGFHALASICNILQCLSLISLGLWVYVRYTGDMPEVGDLIDIMANVIWVTLPKIVLFRKNVMLHLPGRVLDTGGVGMTAPKGSPRHFN